MNAIMDAIPAGQNLLPIVSTENQPPVDLFNRKTMVDTILQILNTISDNKSACTFALSGAWGTGKTFVLDRLREELLAYQDGEKYFVFHYNCWQYDYYEEPLIAIIAAMRDSVDKENHLFSSGIREKAKLGLEIAKPILEKVAKDFFEKKIGIDISGVSDFVKSGAKTVEEVNTHVAEQNEYDKYYAFKGAVEAAQKALEELSQQRTIVVIVDELDRCLPSYAIKVLERIHHLFSGMSNTAVILAVDKTQLEQTVKQIFGEDTQTIQYLKKFISFELQLDKGRITGGFEEKYAEYISLFDKSVMNTDFDFERFYSAVFAGVEVRAQERMIERLMTVHKMLFPNEKKDLSVLCFELLWVVLNDNGPIQTVPFVYRGEYEKGYFTLNSVNSTEHSELKTYMEEEWIALLSKVNVMGVVPKSYWELNEEDMVCIVPWYFEEIMPNKRNSLRFRTTSKNTERYGKNLTDLRKIIELLDIIR